MDITPSENDLLKKITELEPEVDRHKQNYLRTSDELDALRQDLHSVRKSILLKYMGDNFGLLFIGFVIEESTIGDFTVTFSPQVGGEANYNIMKTNLGSDLKNVSTYQVFAYVGKGIPWSSGV